jgi:PAS domain S-box-containing protein
VLRWHSWSIAAKLPFGIGLLLVAVLGGMTWAAYAEVRRSNLGAASERLSSLSVQFADYFEAMAQQRYAALHRLAGDERVASCLRANDAANCEIARLALEQYSKSNGVLAMEVWDADGMRVLTEGGSAPPLDEGEARSLAASVQSSDRVALGDFEVVGDAILYRIVTGIGPPGDVKGYVSEVRRVSNSPQGMRQLTDLLGSQVRLVVGSKGGVWHDLFRTVPAPPPELLEHPHAVEYTSPDGRPMLAFASPIAGSSWFVVSDCPLAPVVAPARSFLRRALLASLALVLGGIGVGWFFSRRMTTPLAAVTRAAETLAAGGAPPSGEPSRRDEIGRLQSSFNSMAREVAESRQRLQRLADHYLLLFEANPLPMWLSSAATQELVQVNAAAARRYGYSTVEFLALSNADIVVATDPPRAHAAQPGAMSGLERHRLKSGRVIDVEVTRCELSFQGRPAVLTLAHDVTERLAAERWLRDSEATLQQLNDALHERIRERAAAEAALRESEQNLSTTLDSIADAVIATDVEGRVVRMNPIAERLTDWSAAEARGRPLAEVFRVVNEDTGEPIESPVERVLREGSIVHLANHSALIARGGTERPIADSGAPIRDVRGQLLGVVLVFRDMTAERTAERALRDKEARKSAVLEAALDCIITMDHLGRVVEFNPAAEQAFGYSQSEVIGKPLGELIVPPDLREEHRAGLASYLERGAAGALGRQFEARGMRSDGTEFPAEISIVRIGQAEPPMFTGFIRDLTRRKQLEAQLRQSQKMEAIGRLAGGVAHDFNNLISVVLGYCELLKADSGGKTHRALDEITAAGMRAADLTRQLLAFSRQQVLEPRRIDLHQIVAGMERMLRRLIGEDIELAFAGDAHAGVVYADPGQVEQIIMNLVVNARDAMPTGGKLTIELRDVELDGDYAAAHADVKPGSYVMLAVSDTGIGMDAATQARMFEPFFTTKEKGKGTGLGLSTVLGIVEQSGGNICVRSEPGQGTRFEVFLPRAERPGPLPSRESKRIDVPVRGTGTILLVEDDEALRALVGRMLEKLGYEVLAASSGDQALDLCRNHAAKIDLVLTDVIMPNLSGRQLVEQLRALRTDVKVLFMSGYTDDTILQHGVTELGVAFLQKPFTPPSLAKKVREVLESQPRAESS